MLHVPLTCAEVEKAEKLKERKAKMEARLKDLKSKKSAGTLTDKESQQLERLEKQAARGDRPPGDRPAGGKRPKKGEANNQYAGQSPLERLNRPSAQRRPSGRRFR